MSVARVRLPPPSYWTGLESSRSRIKPAMARCAEVFEFFDFSNEIFSSERRSRPRRRVSLLPSRSPNLPLSSPSLPATLSSALTWPVAGLVAQRPYDYRRRIFVSLNHPRAALDDRVEPLRVGGRHDGVVAQPRVETVRLEVGLVDEVQPVAGAEVVPVVVVGEKGSGKEKG